MIKFGICTSFDKAIQAINIGYDYVELNMQSVVSLNEDEFEHLLETQKLTNIKVYAFNSFLPSHLKITGTKVSYDEINNYLSVAFIRANLLGGEIIVFGSGGARSVDEGYNYDTAKSQIVEFLVCCSQYAEHYNLTVAIEHLRQEECNILTTIKEVNELVQQINHPRIKLLIDYYHKEASGESNEIIKACVDNVKHIHIASPTLRLYPKSEEESDYKDFFKHLNQLRYDGGVSIEANTNSYEEDLKTSLNF